ncbi:MAG: 23S rRNA (guanosine(2251)-2'-O)-methyltransferase RlmB [Hyphomicrobium sp.]
MLPQCPALPDVRDRLRPPLPKKPEDKSWRDRPQSGGARRGDDRHSHGGRPAGDGDGGTGGGKGKRFGQGGGHRSGRGGRDFGHGRSHGAGHGRDGDTDGPLRLFGLHPVAAALANPQRVLKRLVVTDNAERRLREQLGTLPIATEPTTPRDLDRLLGADAVHQGAMLETEPLPEPDFDDLVAHANGRPLIVLDQVTDPHNVGAILRSAAVFGAAGLVMTRRHSPPLSGVLAKSASGALELVPIALVANLSRALAELKDVGFTVIGLDGTANDFLEDADWSAPVALVMGAEGKGLRHLTAETCDRLARIATDGAIDSLNVSNAAAVALHTAVMARRGKA